MTAPEPAAAPAPATDAASVPPGFVAVARLDEVPPGTLLGVATPDGRRVCLANVDGTICALRDECTHQAFPLSAGELLPDGSVQCAWHGARFAACTGCVLAGPAVDAVTRYEVLVAGDSIWLGPAASDDGQAAGIHPPTIHAQ